MGVCTIIMRYRSYKVALVGFNEDKPRQRKRGPLAGAVGVWHALPWERRLALVCFLCGVLILILHFT